MATMAERILDAAQALAQVRGYNGFSHADVSAELAITKASIHYHFPGKADLAEALEGALLLARAGAPGAGRGSRFPPRRQCRATRDGHWTQPVTHRKPSGRRSWTASAPLS